MTKEQLLEQLNNLINQIIALRDYYIGIDNLPIALTPAQQAIVLSDLKTRIRAIAEDIKTLLV